MNVVTGFKNENRGGHEIIGGPWMDRDGTLRYVWDCNGYPMLAMVGANGRASQINTTNVDLIPTTREVKGSELKVGDRIVAVDGGELGHVSEVMLGRTNARGGCDSWIHNAGIYTIEDNQ